MRPCSLLKRVLCCPGSCLIRCSDNVRLSWSIRTVFGFPIKSVGKQESENIYAFVIPLLVFNGGSLLCARWLCYETRHVSNDLAEGKLDYHFHRFHFSNPVAGHSSVDGCRRRSIHFFFCPCHGVFYHELFDQSVCVLPQHFSRLGDAQRASRLAIIVRSLHFALIIQQHGYIVIGLFVARTAAATLG